MATSMQTTVYNVGIATGSLAGGLILQRAGAGALPWATSALSAAALATVAAARRRAFPADRTPQAVLRFLDPTNPALGEQSPQPGAARLGAGLGCQRADHRRCGP